MYGCNSWKKKSKGLVGKPMSKKGHYMGVHTKPDNPLGYHLQTV